MAKAEGSGRPARKKGRTEQPTRLASQVDLILDGLPDSAVYPATWRDDGVVGYIHRRNVILARDEDVGRVVDALEGRARQREGPSNSRGVTVIELPQEGDFATTEGALAAVDAALGRGVATPDHVLWVCPAGLCPATEPEEVPFRAEPSPGISGDLCDGRGILVSVIDTGWLAEAGNHPWLVDVDGDPEGPYIPPAPIPPYAGHGTFIAGVVRAIAPRVAVYVENAFRAVGAVFESDLVNQLEDALSRGPELISLSAGTNTRADLPLLGFGAIEARLREHKGTLMVAAAGNDSDRRPFWPAAYPWTLSVGALGADERNRAWFSNYGAWVDVFAPGTDLVNAFATGIYTCTEPPNTGEVRTFTGMARWSGTSFSAPLVAGLIAVRMSVTGETSRMAADSLMAYARSQAVPGVGPILLPGDACHDTRHHSHHHHGHGGCCGHRDPC